MSGRLLLQFFGIALLLTALYAFSRSDLFETAVTGVLGIFALIVGFREPLAEQVLPALRNLSLTAVTAAVISMVIPDHELFGADAWLVLIWLALGLIGLVVFYRDERRLDRY